NIPPTLLPIHPATVLSGYFIFKPIPYLHHSKTGLTQLNPLSAEIRQLRTEATECPDLAALSAK
ncbi:MAG: hypothetical protein AAF622_09905, partial [Cyanobacteria bacterium P01_C01_bin.147]